MEVEKKDGKPVFKYRVIGTNLVFNCPLCGKEHWHGKGEQKPGQVEHRAAHCDYPEGDGGYYIFYT